MPRSGFEFTILDTLSWRLKPLGYHGLCVRNEFCTMHAFYAFLKCITVAVVLDTIYFLMKREELTVYLHKKQFLRTSRDDHNIPTVLPAIVFDTHK